MSLLIAGAQLPGRGIVDVRLECEAVVDVEDRIRPRPGEEVLQASGGALLPGLHDHHLHLWAAAAAASSVHVGPPAVRGADALARALRSAAARLGPGEWLRAVGYHESVAGLLDRAALDKVVADYPVRVQHRSGSLWILNSRAIDLAGVDACDEPGVERDGAGRPTGRLWRMDDWLRVVVPAGRVDLAGLSQTAAAMGVVGFTDATPDRGAEDLAELASLAQRGVLLQRLHLMCPIGPAGREGDDRVTTGPVKILLDDDRLPTVDALSDTVTRAHDLGRPVAVHCVTRAQLVITLAALRDTGSRPGDRIEHGSVIPEELIAELRGLGLTVVTQPNFAAERGDEYLDAVDESDRGSLYRCGSLLRAGVATAAGTDAPFGGLDPWAAMRAAVDRRTGSGQVLGPDERVAPIKALRLFLGSAEAPACTRRVELGAPADLCLLHVPLEVALRELSSSVVSATIVAGDPVYVSGA